MSSYRRYIVALLLLTVGWVAVIATVNVVVDPYAVFGSQRTEGLNSRKPEFNKRLSKAKVVEVARLKPENLILGNSRADRGLDPYHSCWESEPVYNMAIPGSTITDIYWYLNYALEVAPIRRVVIDLDFLQMFNLFYRDRIGEPSIPAIVSRSWDSETLVSIFSLDALKSSMRTLTKQNQVTQYSPRGHMRTHQPKEPQDYASVFLDGYMKMQAAIDRKGLFDAEEAQWRYRNFEQMLRLAHEQGVELVLVVSPLHARYLSLIEKSGCVGRIYSMERYVAYRESKCCQRTSS